MTVQPNLAELVAAANGGMTRTYVGVVIVEILVLIGLWTLSAWFTA